MDENSESPPRKQSLSNSKSELTSAERRNRASHRSYSRSRRDRSSSSSSSSSPSPSPPSSSSRRPYFTDPLRERERVAKSQRNSDQISRRMRRQERFRKYRLEKREHRPATAARSYHRSESHDVSGNRSHRTHSRSPPSHETTHDQPQIIIVPVSKSSISTELFGNFPLNMHTSCCFLTINVTISYFSLFKVNNLDLFFCRCHKLRIQWST